MQTRKRLIFYLEKLLLQKRSGSIFRCKCERDYHRVIPLSRVLSFAIFAIILIANILMLVFIIYFGQSTDSDTAYAWTLCVVLALLMDSVVVETVHIFICHILIPQLANSEVRLNVARLVSEMDLTRRGNGGLNLLYNGNFETSRVDRLISNILGLPIWLQDSLSYIALGGTCGAFLLISMYLSRIFSLLSIIPWIGTLFIGYSLYQIFGRYYSYYYGEGRTEMELLSKVIGNEYSNDNVSTVSHKKSIVEFIFPSSNVTNAVSSYKFRHADYIKKHGRAEGLELSRPSSKIVHHKRVDKHDSGEKKEVDAMMSLDNLYVDFCELDDDEQAWRHRLYRQPLSDGCEDEDGYFEHDRYESDSSDEARF